MINLLLLSHSKNLATGLKELVSQMAPDVNIGVSGGTEDGSLGSNFEEIVQKIESLYTPDGLVILFDAGSSMMNAQMALEMLDDQRRKNVILADLPMVEGAIQVSVMAQGGSSLQDVINYIDENRLNKLL